MKQSHKQSEKTMIPKYTFIRPQGAFQGDPPPSATGEVSISQKFLKAGQQLAQKIGPMFASTFKCASDWSGLSSKQVKEFAQKVLPSNGDMNVEPPKREGPTSSKMKK